MRRSGKAKPVVWRWQARFMAEGIEGWCATRHANSASRHCQRPVRRVVDLALEPPDEATYWTVRVLALPVGDPAVGATLP
jgi:hypothetical protein